MTLLVVTRGTRSAGGEPERHVLSAVTRPNERGFTISKGKSRDKIDAAVAMCLSLHQALMPDPAPIEPFVRWGN